MNNNLKDPIVGLLTKGGSGVALAYFLMIGSTAWLGWLPPLPEGQVGWLLVLSLGTIFGTVIQMLRRFLPQEGRGAPQPKPQETET